MRPNAAQHALRALIGEARDFRVAGSSPQPALRPSLASSSKNLIQSNWNRLRSSHTASFVCRYITSRHHSLRCSCGLELKWWQSGAHGGKFDDLERELRGEEFQ